MNWYVSVLKRYVDFNGRARRQEFWMFALISFAISIVLSIIDRILDTSTAYGGLLQSLYGLAVLLPSLGVGVRRLHDTNRSGWWWLIGLIPCVGAIILIVFWAQEGNAGPNPHGPDPKAAERGAGGFPGGEPGYPPPPPPAQ